MSRLARYTGCLIFGMHLACQQQRQPARSGKIAVGDALARPGKCWLRHYVRPVYAEEARKTRAHAVVTMRAFTGKTGAPGEIEVLSGDPMFVPAAITAVKQWR